MECCNFSDSKSSILMGVIGCSQFCRLLEIQMIKNTHKLIYELKQHSVL